eukprot:tig00000525_g1953.t1
MAKKGGGGAAGASPGQTPQQRPSGGDREYYSVDRELLPRIRSSDAYLRSGDAANVDQLVAELRNAHREYSRKPAGPFRAAVMKALQALLSNAASSPTSEFRQRPNPFDEVMIDARAPDSDVAPNSEEPAAEAKERSGAASLNSSLRAVYTSSAASADGAKTPATGAGDRTTNVDGSQVNENDDGASVAKRAKKRARRETGSTGVGFFSSNAGESSERGLGTVAERPSVRYADVGGLDACMQDIRELVEWPLMHPEIYAHLGVQPPRGILLHGPPGCGKTLLAHAIAGELGVPFLKISAPEVVSGMSGESEAKIRSLFASARAVAPCLVFIDEVDAITPKRETASREMERRIVAQLLTSMDEIGTDFGPGVSDSTAPQRGPILVLGATNRPDSVDPALRRAGRFDREIALGIPDAAARARILAVLARRMRLAGDFDFEAISRITPGFVGADLGALTKEAAVFAVHRIFQNLVPVQATAPQPSSSGQDALLSDPSLPAAALEGALQSSRQAELANRTAVSEALRGSRRLTDEELAPLAITMSDFEAAVKKVQPSAKREGFATIPDVTWADVGALQDVRAELEIAVVQPIRQPERFAALGLSVPAGVLLYGPPGCGKTLLAKAIASESGANFISVKGPELLNKYVGESERAVRQVFQRGRASAPCVVFFDELDALCPRRGGDASSGASERVVNQLLTEMDGVDGRQSVFVIAATNRPDMIDPAMLRPGRLEKLLYVPLPGLDGRLSILRALTRRTPMNPDVELDSLAPRTAGFSGADLAALTREACVSALREAPLDAVPGSIRVGKAHWEQAIGRVKPSVSSGDQALYATLRDFREQGADSREPRRPRAPGTGDGDEGGAVSRM